MKICNRNIVRIHHNHQTIIQHKSTTQLLIPKWILQDEALYRWINLKDGVSPREDQPKGEVSLEKGSSSRISLQHYLVIGDSPSCVVKLPLSILGYLSVSSLRT